MKPIQNQRQNQNIAGKPQSLGQPMEKKPMESNKKPMDNKNSGKFGKPEDRNSGKFGRPHDQNSGKH